MPWRRARRRPCGSHPAGSDRRDLRLSAACVCGCDLSDYRGINPIHRSGPRRWVTNTSASSTRSATTSPPSAPVSSSSARSSPATTAPKSAASDTRVPACNENSLAQVGLRPKPAGPRSRTAPSLLPGRAHRRSRTRPAHRLRRAGHRMVRCHRRPSRHGNTVAVGDGAVGLLAVFAARQFGPDRIIAMSRHEPRQERARASAPQTLSPNEATMG